MTCELTTLQMANCQMLLTLAASAKDDLIGTCCAFRVDREVAQRVASMSPPEIMALVINAGDEILFPPRGDLPELLATPLPLFGTIMSVRVPLGPVSKPLAPGRAGAEAA